MVKLFTLDKHFYMTRSITSIFTFLLFLCIPMGCAANAICAEEEFESAWHNPAYTQITLDDVDVNQVLDRNYETSRPIHFTRTLLWDMETKKAWDPRTYIPYVVREGKSWGREVLKNGDEIFVRSSWQKQWLNQGVYEEVFESVYLNKRDQRVTFLGSTTLKDSSGKCLQLENQQPLFHVQHGVEGPENQPINVWRVVFLTKAKDSKLIGALKKLNDPTRLPGFIEIYIEKDLGVSLIHK